MEFGGYNMFLLRPVGFMDNPFDYAISSFMSSIHNSFLNKLCTLFDGLGNFGIFFILLAIILLLSRKTRRFGVVLSIGLLLCLLVNDLFIKKVVGRNRPFMAHEEFLPLVSSILVPPSSPSFVSGHTGLSFMFAFIVLMFNRENKRYWILAYVFAVFMGFSRVYLLVHYFTDVLAGAALGTLLGIGAYYIMKLVDFIYAKAKKEEIRELLVYNEHNLNDKENN